MPSNRDRQESIRLLAQYSSVIFILPSAVIGGFLLGRWIDSRLNSFPWFTVTLVLLGTIGGFVEVFRILNRRS